MNRRNSRNRNSRNRDRNSRSRSPEEMSISPDRRSRRNSRNRDRNSRSRSPDIPERRSRSLQIRSRSPIRQNQVHPEITTEPIEVAGPSQPSRLQLQRPRPRSPSYPPPRPSYMDCSYDGCFGCDYCAPSRSPPRAARAGLSAAAAAAAQQAILPLPPLQPLPPLPYLDSPILYPHSPILYPYSPQYAPASPQYAPASPAYDYIGPLDPDSPLQIQNPLYQTIPNDGHICAICYNPLKTPQDTESKIPTPQETVYWLQCGHAFHASCILTWNRTRQNNCPICKSIVQSYNTIRPAKSFEGTKYKKNHKYKTNHKYKH